MNNLFSVKDKVVIITGGARGNGLALTEGFRAHGAIVYSCDILNKNKKDPNHFIFNIKDVYSLAKFVDQVYENEKHIDVLINNAGVTNSGYTDSAWDETYQINLKSLFNITRLCLKYMVQKTRGSIINITSLNAEVSFPNNPSYIATKGAIKQLTKAIARDYGKYNIRANNLGPGYIITDMTATSYKNEEIRTNRANRTMLGRWGCSEDLVGPAIFLASRASSYITGEDIYVDGGWLAKGE